MLKIAFLATLAAVAIQAPALAYGEACPTHGGSMMSTGNSKTERGARYTLYRCMRGDTWWMPDTLGWDGFQTIQKQSPADYEMPSYASHPCPICNKTTFYKDSGFIEGKFRKVRECGDGHQSVWDQ